MFCSECGNKLETNENFCSECGTPAVSDVSTLSCHFCPATFDNLDELFCAGCGNKRAATSVNAPIPPIPISDPLEPPEAPIRAISTAATPAIIAEKQEKVEDSLFGKPSHHASDPKVGLHKTISSSSPVVLNRIIKPMEISSLARRKNFNAAVPMEETINGHTISKAGDNTTIIKSPNYSHEDLYIGRTLPDDDQWQNILRRHREEKTTFTDAQFPPNASSLCADESDVDGTKLKHVVQKWRRLSEFFTQTAYVQVSMYDDDRKLVCGIAFKTKEDYLHLQSERVDSRFIVTAQTAVTTGLQNKKKEHCMLLTKGMIQSMTEYVDNGKQRFDSIWRDSLLGYYEPLKFSGLGNVKLIRSSEDERYIGRVIAVIPVIFQAPDVHLFTKGKHFGGLRQGQLSDRYLLNSMATLSTTRRVFELFPTISSDLCDTNDATTGSAKVEQRYNDQGVYAVRFWREGKLNVVVVDDWIPCTRDGDPCFAGFTSSGFEFWGIIVEKAYAKLNGSYANIIGGQEALAMADLMGGASENLRVGGVDMDDRFSGSSGTTNLWSCLCTALSGGSLLCCLMASSDLAESPDLFPTSVRSESVVRKDHAYGILGLTEVTIEGKRTRLLRLLNSWDNQSFPGPWNRETGKLWSFFTRSQQLDISGCLDAKDDGSWWIEFDQLQVLFNTVIAIDDFMCQDAVHCFSIYGSWKGDNAAGRDALHLNPQYQLQLVAPDTSSEVTIELEQPSRRPRGLRTYDMHIGLVMANNVVPGERKLNLTSDVVKTSSFIANRSIALRCDIDSSTPIAIIPSTYEKSKYSDFHLMVYSRVQIMVQPIAEDSIPACNICEAVLRDKYHAFENPSTHSKEIICSNCVEEYRNRHAKVCSHCQLPIKLSEGQFSGKYFQLSDGSQCHSECLDMHKLNLAPKCVECDEPIMKIKDRFNGKYYDLQEGEKCHEECIELYRRRNSSDCLHCGDKIVAVKGKYNGQFYKVTVDDQAIPGKENRVHFECWDAYKISTSSKCVHCTEPVMRVAGRFDGRFYELNDGRGKVHFECWDAFRH